MAPPGDSDLAAPSGLRHVRDDTPGFSRSRRGRGFVYLDAGGRRVDDPQEIARIRRLAIPPAWEDVWICPHPHGHIQATGRDAKRRKQYRYHPAWRAWRDETKFTRLIAFGESLPRLRERVEADLRRRGLPREKVLALVLRLLELTLIRVGNDEYAKVNGSFGLTTLRDRHARVDGSTVSFRFRGKGGQVLEVSLRDVRLARLVERCQAIPGSRLFQYLERNGRRHSVMATDVNTYLRETLGRDFSAKDFRTWSATVLAYRALKPGSKNRPENRSEYGPAAHASADSGTASPAWSTKRRRQLVEAVDRVAGRLGNTRTVCRQSYIHPAVMDAYLRHEIEGPPDDSLGRLGAESELPEPSARDEAEVLDLLEKRLTRAQRRGVRMAGVRLAEGRPAKERPTPGQPPKAG